MNEKNNIDDKPKSWFFEKTTKEPNPWQRLIRKKQGKNTDI